MAGSAFTPKAPVYFPKGVLKFANSGHTITKNGSYYVCAEYQKGLCKDKSEERLLRENVEKSFSRLAKRLQIPEGDNDYAINKILKEVLHFQIDYVIDHADNNEEFDAILGVIADDIKLKKKRQLASDIQEAKDAFFKYMKQNSMDIVSSMLVGGIMTFARLQATDSEFGRTLAFLSDEVLLSNSGKIKKIKLNTMGSFIYQFIKKGFPSFGEQVKSKLEYKNFDRLDLKSVAQAVDTGKLADMIPYDPFNTAYGVTTMSRYLLGSMRGVKPENLLIGLLVLENSAILTTAMMYKRIMGGYS